MKRLAAALAFAVLAIGCHRSRGGEARGDAPAPVLEPPTQQELPTSDGSITWGNLQGQIESTEKAIARDPKFYDFREQLVSLYTSRGQFSGSISDYERARDVADKLVVDRPQSASAYLARYGARSNLHDFDGASADLDEASKLGAEPAKVNAGRVTLLDARGHVDEALALATDLANKSPKISNLGRVAALLAEAGRIDEAIAKFHEAAVTYRDVSALPVAWLFFQEGEALTRAGRPAEAKRFYRAAHERLPFYAHAAAHLALAEPPAVAIELLKPLLATTEDPEIETVYGDQLKRAGNAAEAEVHLAKARASYEALMAKHPAAFADHAGWFFLDHGDPQKAFDYAKENLELRKTDRAYELAILAALANGKKAEACAYGGEVAKLPHVDAMLKHAADNACPNR